MFNLLSDSILLHIRTFILGDISTHVSLSQTCRRFRKLYENDESFWQLVCFSAGFGRPRRRGNPDEHLTWRQVAHVLSSHHRTCEIRSCRDAHLYFAKRYRTSSRRSIKTPVSAQQGVVFHSLYFYLHCNQLSPGEAFAYIPVPDAISILLTHLPTFPECRNSQYGPLCSHPNASCTFATFPAVDTISFQDADGRTFLNVSNSDGCTILDVNRALAELIPRDQAPVEVALAHYRDLVQTSGLSLAQFADMVSEQKGFLDDHEYPFLNELVAQA
ncbi:unnamed protein product [Somion occarium]|uniref:F-box domain-containing protein n=1 Tax=Somion occarium TaxID=3059160 RepID=A0ABP1DR84_9APHY